MDDAATRPTERQIRPSKRWRTAVLAVPLLSAASVACFIATLSLSNEHLHHQSAACRYIAVPWTHFATAYGGLLSAVLALLAHIVLFRRARRRGSGPNAGWQSSLAVLFVVIAGLMIPLTSLVTVMTHSDAAETAANISRPMCEG